MKHTLLLLSVLAGTLRLEAQPPDQPNGPPFQGQPEADGSAGPNQGLDEDRPGRGVARISVINGEVSVRRGDSGELTAAALNAPLMAEDRLFTGPQSRAEIQFDSSNMVRVAANAELRLAEVEQHRYMLQLAHGLISFRVLREFDSEIEISTPSIAVRPGKRGMYRIAVREDGTTEITVRAGEVEIFTARGSERLAAGRTMLARGSSNDPEVQNVATPPEDDWDRWNLARDRDLEHSRSTQYVSRDIYGAEDLDQNGQWSYDQPYGWVWSPHVTAGWAPYQSGRWVWTDWYGWTWVSYDSWGWAPYHYGRWYNAHGRWSWWPGGAGVRTWWRPALVGWFGWGGVGVGVGFGRIGWCPLAPYERFQPWYGRGAYGGYRSGYGRGVNIVNNVNITNVYRNSRFANGVTAVNRGDFASGRVTNIHRLSEADLRGASHIRGQVPVVPGRESLRMADRQPVRAGIGASSSGNERFYSRRTPAAVDRVNFEQQRRGLEQTSNRAFGGSQGAQGFGAPRGGVNPAAGSPGNQSGADRGGWQRFGEPAARAGQGISRSQSGVQAGGADTGGWRRFGEPSAPSAAQGRMSGQSATPGNTHSSERLGRGASSNSQNPDSWRRFGSGGSGVQQNPGQVDNAGSAVNPGYSPSPRYQGYGQPRADSMRYQQPSQPVRISPSIVNERSGSGYNAPRAASPSYQNSGSRSYGGGSSPSVRSSPAPRSSPSPRSSPASSGHSGGGGHSSGGGGRSSGGGHSGGGRR